ncbi:hypothetical protein [Sinorhizobium meliloti]|nr:hypothetical protein [Sinorhizobium meliloti]
MPVIESAPPIRILSSSAMAVEEASAKLAAARNSLEVLIMVVPLIDAIRQ